MCTTAKQVTLNKAYTKHIITNYSLANSLSSISQ